MIVDSPVCLTVTSWFLKINAAFKFCVFPSLTLSLTVFPDFIMLFSLPRGMVSRNGNFIYFL